MLATQKYNLLLPSRLERDFVLLSISPGDPPSVVPLD